MSQTVKIPITEEIDTQRCKLRIVSEGDIPHVWSATRHNGFNDGLRWDAPKRIKDLKKPLAQNFAAWKIGAAYTWTIEKLNSAEFIGRIVLKKDAAENNWSIGFWIHPIYQRNGYATEAAKAIIYFAFTKLNAENIYSSHANWNISSQRVLEKLAMKMIGKNPCGLMKNGECVAEYVYAITQDMWQRGNGSNMDRQLTLNDVTA